MRGVDIPWYRNVVEVLLAHKGRASVDTIYLETGMRRCEATDNFLKSCQRLSWIPHERLEFNHLQPRVTCQNGLERYLQAEFPRAVEMHSLYGAYAHVWNDIDALVYAKKAYMTGTTNIPCVIWVPQHLPLPMPARWDKPAPHDGIAAFGEVPFTDVSHGQLA